MSNYEKPLLSIVVPSFNSERYIEDCLQSLEAQRRDDVEYLLIDGGSTDSTMAIVECYRHLFTVIISEEDKGQSDAFNKGYGLAKGEYLTWLNSDDVLISKALDFAVNWIYRKQKDWYAANVIYLDSEGGVMRCCRSGGFEKWALSYGVLNVFGPSTIFKRSLYEQLGDFREDFHYSMDTEYWWRIASTGVEFERIPIYFWGLRLHDAAKTAAVVTGGAGVRPPKMVQEAEVCRKLYYPKAGAKKRKVGIMLARLFRILNMSYVRSLWDTCRFKGKSVEFLK